jgi:hypothetical protein
MGPDGSIFPGSLCQLDYLPEHSPRAFHLYALSRQSLLKVHSKGSWFTLVIWHYKDGRAYRVFCKPATPKSKSHVFIELLKALLRNQE